MSETTSYDIRRHGRGGQGAVTSAKILAEADFLGLDPSPVLHAEARSATKTGKLTCQQCWVYCPDACIAQGIPPAIDPTCCKGCGICAQECPSNAIEMQPEAAHGVCAAGEAAQTKAG